MYHYVKLALLSAALVLPATGIAQDQENRRPEVKRYEDQAHHDSHEWNEREDQTYRRYLQERHKKYHDFAKAGRRQQQDYWNWRHNHPDTDRR